LFALVAGKGNYVAAAAVARGLTPFVYMRILNNVLAPLYQGVGEPRTLTMLSVLQMLLLAPALVLGAKLGGVVGVACAVSAVMVAVSGVLVLLVSRRFEVALSEQLKAVLLPVVSAAPAVVVGHLLLPLAVLPAARLALGAAVVTALFFGAWELIHHASAKVPSLVGPLARLFWKRLRPQGGAT
jgi:PST family polysaccharide transporter